MQKRFFELSQDVQVPGCWHLGDPTKQNGEEIDPWIFTNGSSVRIDEQLKVPIYRPGKPLDFSTAGVGVTPVVHVRVATLFAELAPDDIQLLPVDIPAQPEQYCILVTKRLIRCIDDERSTEVRYWKPEDGRPEKVGKYRSVYRMRVDPEKAGDARVFRTWGWEIALVVSEDLKEAIERAGVTGAKFREA